ncbi:MAG: hypothetical protein FH761_19345 [Firmicutes bacterium]|nr:hypothetical protein [Bacillota bacterium]
MSYTEKIAQAKEESRNTSIATKIRDMMQNVRLTSDGDVERRWIWELLQNAKDVANPNSKIDIEIDLDSDNSTLRFKHNGKPFTSKNVTFLIEQVSSKDQYPSQNSEVKETGKFGTGFLTTHLLSEIVELTSLLKEDNEPCKSFTITLDRSGRDIQTIIDSVENSLKQLAYVEHSPDVEYNPNELNTSFSYILDERGVSVAKKGVEDLYNLIAYTLIFVPEINSVTIKHENTRIFLDNDVEKLTDNMTIYKINYIKGTSNDEKFILVMDKDDIYLAIEIDYSGGDISFKDFNMKLPKIFCDFPMIGTDKFPFPVILNCSKLNPNEPRSGIFLTDKSDDLVEENKKIIKEAIQMVYGLIDYSSMNNFRNMYILIKNMKSNIDTNWISKTWMKDEIILPLKKKLLTTAIVDVQNGNRYPIINDEEYQILFSSHQHQKIREKLYDLTFYLFPNKLPFKEQREHWYNAIWSDSRKLRLETLSSAIENFKNIEELQQRLGESIDAHKWLNEYYRLLLEEERFIEEIIADKYEIIPNQNGKFMKYSDLFIDHDIDNELKDILLLLGHDCRRYLVNQDIITDKIFRFRQKTSRAIVTLINENLEKSNSQLKLDASIRLVSLFSQAEDFPAARKQVFDFTKNVFSDLEVTKQIISNWTDHLWDVADKVIIDNLAEAISSESNIENLAIRLSAETKEETLLWLNEFISYITNNDYENFLNRKLYPILPNQYGEFCIKDDLFLDDEIDETLKGLCKELGYDYQDKLLDKSIFLEISQSRTRNINDIAEKICFLVKGRLNDLLSDEQTKITLRNLLVWFNENETDAKKYFPELWQTKHRFLGDDELIESLDKASRYDELVKTLKDTGHGSIEQFIESITLLAADESEPKQELNNELLAQLGITSKEELELAMKNPSFASKFVHSSESDKIKFDYVQEIIDRSINNVFRYLKETRPEYNIEDPDEIARTIFSCEKNGEELYIIIRPSDYKQIIIYYDSEKDFLDYRKDVELWVDDGVSKPEKITFGKILKITGINKIPLRRLR